MSKLSVRGGFSDRNGIKPENTEIQLKEFDKRTRVQLQNMISELYVLVFGSNEYHLKEQQQKFIRYVLGTIYSECIDARKTYRVEEIFGVMNNTISHGTFDEVLTLLEALIVYWELYLKEHDIYLYNAIVSKHNVKSLYEYANCLFEKEYIGYRFVDNIIVPISDSYEADTINETLNCKYQPVREHISKANSLLADRDKPDYENSIKESIAAVEAMSEIITGIKGKEATLANMLKKIEDRGIKIHGGLKSAFDKLYGYTSDANGIRHAGDIGGPSSTFEEAKFMLVACCAFINYLIALDADK